MVGDGEAKVMWNGPDFFDGADAAKARALVSGQRAGMIRGAGVHRHAANGA
jgi:hypothetical protein